MSTLMPFPKNLLIGHRGAGKLAPENTLASFQLAAKMGLNWVEFDTQPCQTGEWVIMHDEDLFRTTGFQGLVSETPFKIIQSLQVPLLEETLKCLAELKVHPNIEIKIPEEVEDSEDPENSSVASKKNCKTGIDKNMLSFVETVRTHWPVENPLPLISSFNLDALIALKALEPTWPLGFLVEDFEKNSFEMIFQKVIEHNFYSLHCDYRHLKRDDLEVCKEANIPVLVYTVNDPENARQCIDMGVSGIFSDDPNLLTI